MDPSLLILGLSHHWDSPPADLKTYNEVNPGLGLKFEWEDDEHVRLNVIMGGYKNSYYDESLFAGPGLEVGASFGLQMNLIYVTGYEHLQSSRRVGDAYIAPMVGLYYRFERYSIHTIYMGNCVAIYGEIRL